MKRAAVAVLLALAAGSSFVYFLQPTLGTATVGLVFYAGHGMQIKGENYLPAVDAVIDGEDDVPTQSLALRQVLDALGEVPLPPYITRADKVQQEQDRERYQTVFAQPPGSVAAPTAGLHFDEAMLKRISATGAGIEAASLLKGFDLTDGVQCESCHGPGANGAATDVEHGLQYAISGADTRGAVLGDRAVGATVVGDNAVRRSDRARP